MKNSLSCNCPSFCLSVSLLDAVIVSSLLRMRVKETCSLHYSMEERPIQYFTIRYDLRIICPHLLLLYVWLVMFLLLMCEGRREVHSYTGKLRAPKKPHAAGFEPPKGHRARQRQRSDSIYKGTRPVVTQSTSMTFWPVSNLCFLFFQFSTSSHLMILQQLNVACEIVQLRWRSNWSLIGYLECRSAVWQLFCMCMCFFSAASRNLLTWGLQVKKGAIWRKWCKLQMSVF